MATHRSWRSHLVRNSHTINWNHTQSMHKYTKKTHTNLHNIREHWATQKDHVLTTRRVLDANLELFHSLRVACQSKGTEENKTINNNHSAKDELQHMEKRVWNKVFKVSTHINWQQRNNSRHYCTFQNFIQISVLNILFESGGQTGVHRRTTWGMTMG